MEPKAEARYSGGEPPFAGWPRKLHGFFSRKALLRLLRRLALSRLLGFCLLVALMALRVWDPAPLETLRLKVFDLYQLANPRQPVAAPVVIVDIDEESLAAIGQWPWPRIKVAQMVDRLRLAGVVAIAFDVEIGRASCRERVCQYV